VALVYLTRPLVDSVLTACAPRRIPPGSHRRSLMAAVLLAGEALRALGTWVSTAQSELVHNHISSLVQRKSAEVDLGFYEPLNSLTTCHRAKAEASLVPLALIENLGGLAQTASR